jgi:hypothetical protein
MELQARDALTKALEGLHRNPENPEAVIAGFETQAFQREEQSEKLQAEAIALRDIAQGMRTLLGGQKAPQSEPDEAPAPPATSSQQANGVRPEGMEAVRRIMSQGGVWTGGQILEEMKRRGWESKESKNPIRPTEAAINRLWKVKKEIERVGRGRYQYIGPPSARDEATDRLALAGDESHEDKDQVESPLTG